MLSRLTACARWCYSTTLPTQTKQGLTTQQNVTVIVGIDVAEAERLNGTNTGGNGKRGDKRSLDLTLEP